MTFHSGQADSGVTRGAYPNLMGQGIFEYTPGFIIAECEVADDEFAVVGTVL